MATSPITAAQHTPVRLRMRMDLQVSQQTHQGQRQWILKDSLARKYFRLSAQQFAVLELLDGKRSLVQIKESLRQKFPQLAATHSQLQSLVMQLHRSGVVYSESLGQGEQLLQRHRKQKRQQWISRLFSVFAIRFPGVDPDWFLGKIYRSIRCVFHPISIAISVAMMIAAVSMILIDLDYFLGRLPAFQEFFGAGNLVWMMLALAFAKVVHELGHGLTCKHFGAECHEIGLMFLVFTPCLYCDTSDSWMVASKWRRAAIGAAGMYFELTLAALCSFIWVATTPGLLNFLCLNTIFICSVSTLVFNGNPLLRYDGYYILSDLMEVPNLARKAQSALLGFLKFHCLGLPWSTESTIPSKLRTLFAGYAVASFFYRIFVLVLILWFASKIFEPYGLKPIGDVLITISLVGILIIPLVKAGKYFLIPGKLSQVNSKRLIGTCIAIAMLLSFLAFVPVPHHVYAVVSIEPRGAVRVYVDVEGNLAQQYVEPGAKVKVGDPLARLVNPTLDFEAEKIGGQLQQLETKLTNLRRQQSADPSAATAIPYTQTSLEAMQVRLTQVRDRHSRLLLTAPTAGTIFSPPRTPEATTTSGQLGVWSGTPLQSQNIGCYLPASTCICLIGDPSEFEAVAVIDQTAANYVSEADPVEIVLDEILGRRWESVVAEIAAVDTKVTPRELSIKSGGDLDTTTDATGAERPSAASYQARIAIPDGDQQLIQGFRGQAKIYVGSRPLGTRLLRFLRQTFRFH
ncbi:Peptidase family M50 [Rosistilla ulvae]|uniref:Peptidase family M50 n=1 Tax=Rosistilla ulvae TaxID=1930277 RepID=A0A517LYV6_9BACT|nr:hemolysin D [Rosistilla ulvae]QDS87801.1 Peptidase family M50 [Rosistilla ulvae]